MNATQDLVCRETGKLSRDIFAQTVAMTPAMPGLTLNFFGILPYYGWMVEGGDGARPWPIDLLLILSKPRFMPVQMGLEGL
jgi:hypothetical protein